MKGHGTRRFLMCIALVAAVWGGVSTWFYVNDLVQPVLAPMNQSYAGYANVPRKAPGLRMEPFTFKGWDKDFTNVTGDLTVKAEFESIPNKYTVTCEYQGIKITNKVLVTASMTHPPFATAL